MAVVPPSGGVHRYDLVSRCSVVGCSNDQDWRGFMDDMCIGKQQAVLRHEHAGANGYGMGFIIDTDDEPLSLPCWDGTARLPSTPGPCSERPHARQDGDDGRSNEVATMEC